MRVNGGEGTPVPIPNTVVKLVRGDDTWLETARENNSARTSVKGNDFVSHCLLFYSLKRFIALYYPARRHFGGRGSMQKR